MKNILKTSETYIAPARGTLEMTVDCYREQGYTH
jgi:hypothetical protein